MNPSLGPSSEDLDALVGNLLHRRANQIDVKPDINAVIDNQTVMHLDTRAGWKARSGLLVAAAAVIITVVGGGGFYSRGPTELGSDRAQPLSGAGSIGVSAAATIPTPGHQELFVWITPSATSEEIATDACLAELITVEGYRYLNQEANYAEFTSVYQDRPEIVAVVRADDLPSRFEVVTSEPEQVAEVVKSLTSVIEAEWS